MKRRSKRQERAQRGGGFQHDGKWSKQADKETVQTAVMDRLSEEVAQASVQAGGKRDRLESARRACQETATAIQAKVEACGNSVNVAVAVHRAVVEHFAFAVQLNKHKQSTCESSHESGAGSVVSPHAGCDPRCHGSRNGGTDSE